MGKKTRNHNEKVKLPSEVKALGWGWFALIYLGFAIAGAALHIWGLFLAYGLFFGLTEGVERAYVADLAGEENRGYAFGWFHLAVGIGALPASLIFGGIWHLLGPQAAFILGGCLALISMGLLLILVRPVSSSMTVL